MAGTFDFAPGKHVAVEIAPAEPKVTSFNGWDFTSKPAVPYRPKFRLQLGGMRWYLNSGGTALDLTTDPTFNLGRLRKFYIDNRLWDTFTYSHEYLGDITCRFAEEVSLPKALPDAGGLAPEFEVVLLWHNPGYV